MHLLQNQVVLAGCTGGGKSSMLAELARRACILSRDGHVAERRLDERTLRLADLLLPDEAHEVGDHLLRSLERRPPLAQAMLARRGVALVGELDRMRIQPADALHRIDLRRVVRQHDANQIVRRFWRGQQFGEPSPKRADAPPRHERDRHISLEDPGELPPMLEVIADGAAGRFDELPMPKRQCPAGIMRHLFQAMDRNLKIEIDYVSMSSGKTTSQWIAPTRIGYDGERLHFRAWSYRHDEWRDYLPVRVSEASSFATQPLPEALPLDLDWETKVRVALRPRGDLSAEQQRTARDEYGSADAEVLIVQTRAALAFYLDRRWGLDLPSSRLEHMPDE